jgi:2'-5' RNA ligase
MTAMADEPPETIRAFVAFELDSMSLRRVARVADRLRMGSGAPSATWTSPGRMHITLKFIAELPLETVAPLGEALRPLVEGKSPPKGCALRLDAFPAVEQARVVIAALDDRSGGLGKLADKVERIAHKLGAPRERHAFRPHVTLARLKRPYDARRWLRPELVDGAGECGVASMTLFRSQLGSAGSSYTALARFAFDTG